MAQDYRVAPFLSKCPLAPSVFFLFFGKFSYFFCISKQCSNLLKIDEIDIWRVYNFLFFFNYLRSFGHLQTSSIIPKCFIGLGHWSLCNFNPSTPLISYFAFRMSQEIIKIIIIYENSNKHQQLIEDVRELSIYKVTYNWLIWSYI